MAVNDLRVVFIDDGGVLNDNDARAPQWRRLLGQFLTPRLGGTPDAWAAANVGAFERSWARYVAHVEGAGDARGIEKWSREERARWLIDMCEQVGVGVPPSPSDYAIAVGRWVSERVRSEIPGAIDAVRWLHGRGLVLNTASGGMSWELEPYLRAMGIRDLFDHLYGPDLIDRYKNGPHFYEALLADAGVDADAAVVVDDGEKVRGWARDAGLRTFDSLAALRTALD